MAEMDLRDDLGFPVGLSRPPTRVVSLVPSLTEALAVTVPDHLVGATDWCSYPAELNVTRVRGTKNPNRAAIIELRPDLVVANKEENRRIDIDRLREAGLNVWVTEIESVDAALSSMSRLFVEGLDVDEPGWLSMAKDEWARPVPSQSIRVIVPIWRHPWMVVGSSTFTGDILGRLGLVHLYGDSNERYPKLSDQQLLAAQPDLVLLPDEPYVFTATDGPEAFPSCDVALVSGRLLTWYGPSMATAKAELLNQISRSRHR